MPRRISSAGTAMSSSSAMLASPVRIARTWRIGVTLPGFGAEPSASCVRSLRLRARIPINPISAGVKVIAMSTATATQIAATEPMSPRNPMPETFSASSATMTVAPAKTTALPEVPLASPIDSSRS